MDGQTSLSNGNTDAGAGSRRIEVTVAVFITLAAITLHVVFLGSAGALWRDEAGVVRLATLPGLGETLSRLGHESCPLLFPAIIRVWTAIGLAHSDFTLRIYGFLVGLLFLGTIWLGARWHTRAVPLVALGLLGVNLTVVRWGDSLRAYGVGSVLMLLGLLLVGRFVLAPSRRLWLVAAGCGVLCVQALFQNALLLFAVCLAGCLVRLRLRDERGAGAAFAIGIPAAVSLLPYLHIIHKAQDWSRLSQADYNIEVLIERFLSAQGGAVPWTSLLWGVLVLLALFLGGKAWLFGDYRHRRDITKRTAFAGLALAVGIPSYFIFLRLAKLPTQIWYYLPLISFMAVCLELALADWLSRFWRWRMALAFLLPALLFPRTFEQARYRQTNMDQVAAELQRRVGPNDLIIVHPWFLGISFDRYYKGAAPWTTLPPIEDHRFHRYDLFKLKMQMKNAVGPVVNQADETLQSGHHIYIVGELPLDAKMPQAPDSAPDSAVGLMEEQYSQFWAAQVGYSIATRARDLDVTLSDSTNRVSRFEHIRVTSLFGGQLP